MILPINGHIQIAPIKEGGIVQRENSKYEEKGTIINIGNVVYVDIKVGDTVFFDGWLASKYGQDTDDEKWFLKYNDIRAVETKDNVSLS